MRSTSLILGTVASLALALGACSSDDDGTPGDIDASTAIDAPTTIDAPMGSALGRACTGTGQGSCPAGFTCLSLVGGSGPWCSKTCTDPQDPSCADGYAGVGFPACVLGVRPPGAPPNDPGVLHCQIICEDLPGAPNICEPGECIGACPAPLMCTAELKSTTTMQLLARGCQ